MTATSACRIELEALRERLSAIIHELKHVERMIEAEDNLYLVTLHGRETVVPLDRVPPKGSPPASISTKLITVATTRATSPNDAKVLSALTGQGWLRIDEVIKRAKLPKGTAYTRLTRLHGSGQVETQTEGRRTLYRLATKRAAASPQPRSGAGAGTQAAPPAGPPPTNGRQASSGGFEIAWNGTKERNGEAPSILPPRERKP